MEPTAKRLQHRRIADYMHTLSPSSSLLRLADCKIILLTRMRVDVGGRTRWMHVISH